MQNESSHFAFSRSQRNIWTLEQRYAGTSINVISATVQVTGHVDFTLLARSVNLLLEADASLRLRLLPSDGEPLQTYAPYEETQFPVLDFTQTDPDGVEHWMTATAREPMPLYGAPLCRFYLFRLGEEEGGLLLKAHHLISDGWSQVLLCNRIAETYLSLLEGGAPTPTPSPDYRTHIRQEQEYLEEKACARDESYWKTLLEEPSEPLQFKEQRGADLSPVGRRLSFRLPEVLNHAIETFCRARRVSPFAPYYMALAIAAQRMGCGKRFAVGIPIHNRADLTAKQTTGMFVSTLPLITELDESWTAEEFCERLGESWMELLRHQRYPYERIEALPRAGGGRLFTTALSYQDNLSYKSERATVRFSGRWHYSGYQSEQLCIHITNLEDHRRYTVDYDYLTQLFTAEEIAQLHRVICAILDQLLHYQTRPIREVSILSTDEREQVVYTFNATPAPAVGGLFAAFAETAAAHPSRVALIERGAEQEKLTYDMLYGRALALGAALQEAGCGKETLVAVLLPRGNLLGVAMTGVMAAGGAWLLLSPDLPTARLQELLTGSGAGLLLTSESLCTTRSCREFGLPVLLADRLAPEGDGFSPALVSMDALAYVVYTSGSTGKPKGVEITQSNLLNFAAGMRQVFPQGAMLSLTNVSFDAFVLESAVSLLNGLTVVFASDETQEDPDAMAALLHDFGVDYLSMTPSRLRTYLQYSAFRAVLSGRKGILCGGEAFPGDLLSDLKELTAAHIYNQYGPSETTVGVSIAELSHCAQISVGKPMRGCALYILDKRLEPLPIGVAGELYIGGACVGRGYRGAPELTSRAFQDDPFLTGGRMYRTGDVGCWTAEGELRLRGRRDRQLKLRGQRVEPDELAFCLLRHPAVRQSAVRAAEQFGQTVLCAYYTSEEPVSEQELMQFLGSRLPVYLLPARILRLDAMPMTSSGKVDEKALPMPEFGRGDRIPSTDLQREIVAVFRDVLGRPELGADGDYFLFGGNSLNAMETVGRLEPILGRRLRISNLYACRSAVQLEQWLRGGTDAPSAPLSPLRRAEARECYPLSEIQRNIYIECLIGSGGMAYHMPGAFRLGIVPDQARLESAFRTLIAEDDLYRTAFQIEDDRPVAKILPEVAFSLPVLSSADFASAWAEFLQPFALDRPPLLRAALWRDETGWVLLLDVHHIVGDGVSTPMLLSRLNAFYLGKHPAPLSLTYRDFCCEEERRDPSEALLAWTEHLKDLPEALDLPADLPRPRPFDFAGAHAAFALSDRLASACRDFCTERSLTPYMLFTAAYCLLLARISGRDAVVVGTPVSGRNRPELWQICGPFLSTLPLRLSVGAGETVCAYLDRVRQEVLWLLDHPELPADQVLTALDLPRTYGENPLYQAMFSYRPLDVSALTLGGAPLTMLEADAGTAKLELCLEAAETADTFSFTFEYASSVFEQETIAFYGRCLAALLGEMTAAPDRRLSELAMISDADRLTLLDIPNQMTVPFRSVSVDRLVSEQAARTPDAPAVCFHGEITTFRALEERAAGLAGLLQQSGARPGGRVGLCCRRGPDLFAGMLAILKAGCAYVPFLPDYPAQRVAYMLETAQADVVLCDEACRHALEGMELPGLVNMESGMAAYAPCAVSPSALAYILFTSGSTGKPKGVMVTRRAVANFCAGMRDILAMDEGPVLCVTNMTFDIFLAEGLLPLSMGRRVILADEDERTLPWKMAACMESAQVTTMQITPSQLQMCLADDSFRRAVRQVRLLLLAGEASNSHLVELAAAATDAALIDVYGPTEATVYVSASRLYPNRPVTIGKPLQNCRMYVLDKALRPALPTARGELYLAGVCLSEGYVGRPDLTEAAFVEDPFFPDERMYRTGDLARRKPDGVIECLGRIDAQIKLNGLRIELSEISGAALDSGLVSQCVVLPVEHGDGSAFLRAFAVPAEGADEAALLSHMRGLLPTYMLPAEIVFLPAIPVNPSGKADLPKLKSWVPEVSRADVPAPQTSAPAVPDASEKQAGPATQQPVMPVLSAIWRASLGCEAVSETESFFRQGGTSLSALGVLTKYYSAGYSMTMADFYAHPTLSEQAGLLGDTVSAAPAAPDAPNAPSVICPAPMQTLGGSGLPAGCVLLTGATGFLGAHLLRELLDGDAAARVVCVLRDGDKARLFSILGQYFGSAWSAQQGWKISVVRGDLTRPHMGMLSDNYAALSSMADVVFHTAADVRHYASDQNSQLTNVLGTANAAQFALEAGIPFHHVSTISICGEYVVAEPERRADFTEADFDIGQNWHDNIYMKGKFLAEREVYDRMERGLNARVYRVGRLVGRDSDGVFQLRPETNALYLTLRGLQIVGALPEAMAGTPIDLTPVDFCAKAILALSGGPMPVCHIADPTPVSLLEAARAVLPGIPALSGETFSTLLGAMLAGENAAQLAPLLDQWNRAHTCGEARITPRWESTLVQLRAGGFAMPESTPETRLRAFRIDAERGESDS
ncbi:MAG: amino acid adenylation domain-containing protein [Oscillospiraceae bacterium]|nr:amino acid adenylation domain-containing protein [Oscillospiraceae bacterium]